MSDDIRDFLVVKNGKIVTEPRTGLWTQIVLWLLAIGAIFAALFLAEPEAKADPVLTGTEGIIAQGIAEATCEKLDEYPSVSILDQMVQILRNEGYAYDDSVQILGTAIGLGGCYDRHASLVKSFDNGSLL